MSISLRILGLGVFLLASCHTFVHPPACDDFHITRRPIGFDSTRIRLSLEYMESHYGIHKDQPVIAPKMVVIHWTDIPTVDQTFDAFNPSVLPSSRKKIGSASALNVSAHFVVNRSGKVYRLLPDTAFARHVIGLNHCAIGIENIGGKNAPLTDKQLQANICLIRMLSHLYPIEYVLGHHEYTRFTSHPLWLEKDPNYLTQKIDPGNDFMRALRMELAPLALKPLPAPDKQAKPTIDEIPRK